MTKTPENTYTSLFKISLFLSSKGFKWTQVEWECKESKEVYVLTRYAENDGIRKKGDKITRHLRKNELFTISNLLISQPSVVEFNIITPFERIDEAKKVLMDKVVSTVTEFKEEIDKLDAIVKLFSI